MAYHYRLNFRVEFRRNCDWMLSNWFRPSWWKVTVVTLLPALFDICSCFRSFFSPAVANLEPIQSWSVICRAKRARASKSSRFFSQHRTYFLLILCRNGLSIAPILVAPARQVSCGSHDIFSGHGPNVPLCLPCLLSLCSFSLIRYATR